MIQSIFEFLSFSDVGTRNVTLGVIILGAISSLVGCFTFLQKRALIGDTIAHSVLPGIGLAFIISGTKDPYFLLLGAFLSGWLSVLLSDYITRNTKIKSDTSIAIILSFFFAIGIMLLSIIQHSGNPNQAGLHHFLFGKAAAIVQEDINMFYIIGGISLIVILLFYNAFKVYIFDIDFAKSIGLPVKWLDFLLTTLTVLAIAVGIRAVGVVMMAALLIAPAAAARFWTINLKKMLVLAVFIGSFAGFMGALISYLSPKMPTGPWIIVVLSLIAFTSILLGKEKGVFQKWLKRKSFERKVLQENILKIFFHLGEEENAFYKKRSTSELLNRRMMPTAEFKKGIKQLINKKWLSETDQNTYKLTESGIIESKRLVRLHRLWELYLTQYLNIAPDHVHDDAEAIEHILTPNLQMQLETILEGQKVDPHDKVIPEIPKRNLN